MIISPPPIQEPWRLDQSGRLQSAAWVLWLQNLASMSQVEDIFSDTLTTQSTLTVSSRQDETTTADDALLFSWMSF